MKKVKKDQQDREAYEGDNNEPPTPTEAFINSDGHYLEGYTDEGGKLKKLEPYTPERIWAADAIGIRYGKLNKADIRQWRTMGVYPGMEGDVNIVIWLCSLTDVAEVMSARRDPDNALRLAADFAVEHGIVSMKQKKFWKAQKVFLAIMDEISAAYGEPEGNNSEQKKTETTTTEP